MKTTKNSHKVAIFWDYENVRVIAKGKNVPLAESLFQFGENLGMISVMKVYANWANINNIITQSLYSLGFEPLHVSMGKTNSVDVKLSVDVMDCAMHHPKINHYIIITGDKDFIPLVNWLKLHGRKVTIIGNPQVVSEHLLLSATEFVSLKSLSRVEPDKTLRESSRALEKKKPNIPFSDAVQYLKTTIKQNRTRGKSTRFLLVDQFMRASETFDYEGISTVLKPSGNETFSSFGEFIDLVEQKNEIKSETVEGFRELFLMGEDPDLESEFSPELLGKIKPKHLPVIFDQMEEAFKNRKRKKNQKNVGRNFLKAFLGNLKRQNGLKYNTQAFESVIDMFVKVGVLNQVSKKKYSFSRDAKSRLNSVMDSLN